MVLTSQDMFKKHRLIFVFTTLTIVGLIYFNAPKVSSASCPNYTFIRNLYTGSTGNDVRNLQLSLNCSVGTNLRGTTYFGIATRAGVIKYQKSKGITPAYGYFGPATRAAINSDLASVNISNTPATDTPSPSNTISQPSATTLTCQAPTNLNPSGNVNGNIVNLSWDIAPGAVAYNVRLGDGSTDRYDDSRFITCPNSPHYYCENGITSASITNIPVKQGRKYYFWVDPIYFPARNYCNGSTTFTVASAPTPTPISAAKLSTSGIRSVTFNIPGEDLGATDQFYNKLSAVLPSIKSTGFNTLWLVNWWQVFEPTALPQASYNEAAFVRLRKVLDLLRANNMKAILGVNYIGGYRPPQGVDGLHWIQNPDQYKTFETYLAKYLTEIKSYNDMVYIMVFTENSEPEGMTDQAHAQQLAGLLRPTLGSMPTRLPQDLRNLFTIGYHDYSIINLGWGNGQSPITGPNPYDFVSMVAYGQDLLSYADLNTEVAARAQRFKNLYPNTPLMIGELGGDYCDNNEQNQARVVGTIVSYALKNNMGSNVWGWFNKAACGASDYDQFGITKPDGSLHQATQILKQVFSGQSSVENWLKLPVPDNNTPVGQFDMISTDGKAIGWAYDPDEPSLPIHVVFYLDGDAVSGGKQIGEINANSSRPDVNTALGISGSHGFIWPIPQQYKDGKQHILYVYGRDSSYDGRRNRLINGTKTFAFNPDGSVVPIVAKDPSGFGATIDSSVCGKVSLYWFRNGADSFNLYRSTTNNASSAQKVVSNQIYTDQTYGGYVDLNVSAGTYYYWVENVNGPTRVALYNNGKGGLFIPGCNAAPAQDPSGFGGKIVTEICGRIDIWWFRNSAGAYNLYRSTSNDVTSAQKIVGNLSYTDPTYGGYSDVNLSAATYYYWVENVGSAGNKVSLYNNSQGGLIVGACN